MGQLVGIIQVNGETAKVWYVEVEVRVEDEPTIGGLSPRLKVPAIAVEIRPECLRGST